MYLLDANIFIQAKNFYYGFDICPGFWEWMDQAAEGRSVYSITKVYDELVDGHDELADWSRDRKGDGRFIDVSDITTQKMFGEIAVCVQGGPYHDPAKRDFLAKADPWLVAKAKAVGATVVTHEKLAPAALRKVPLPNICNAFGVPFIDTFRLLQVHSAAFGLLV